MNTVMQIATAETLVDCKWTTLKELYCKMAGKYIGCMYDMDGRPIKQWGRLLYDTLSKAKECVKNEGRDGKENVEAWSYFEVQWKNYFSSRGIFDLDSGDVKFPDEYGERDKLHHEIIFSGASGHDAPIIAYNAILGALGTDSRAELCSCSMFHGGDSDSTGIIAAALYGAMHGFKGVPEGSYKSLEYCDGMEKLAKILCAGYHVTG